ncbi:MAG: tyrosine-type recombinase/integrase [Verrucomicrobiales bacterium]
MKIATEWEKAASKARQGLLTELQSMKVLSDLSEITSGKPLSFHSVEDWLRSWLEGKKASRAEKTYLRYVVAVEAFLKHLPKNRKEANLGSLAAADIQSFRDASIASGKSATTVNMELKILRTAFNVARKQAIIPHNPAEAVDTIEADALEKDVFTPDMVKRLVAAAEDKAINARSAKDRDIFRDWSDLICAGYFTGARQGDLVELRRSNVSFDRLVIEFSPQKQQRRLSKKKVAIPIHPEFASRLEKRLEWLPENADQPIFPALVGKTSGGRNGLSGMFNRLMENAGIQGTIVKGTGKAGRSKNSLTFHSLRHTFNSALMNAGVSK